MQQKNNQQFQIPNSFYFQIDTQFVQKILNTPTQYRCTLVISKNKQNISLKFQSPKQNSIILNLFKFKKNVKQTFSYQNNQLNLIQSHCSAYIQKNYISYIKKKIGHQPKYLVGNQEQQEEVHTSEKCWSRQLDEIVSKLIRIFNRCNKIQYEFEEIVDEFEQDYGILPSNIQFERCLNKVCKKVVTNKGLVYKVKQEYDWMKKKVKTEKSKKQE